MLKTIVKSFIFLNDEKISTEGPSCLTELENAIVSSSRSFFQARAQHMLASYTLVEYLTMADQILKDEQSRLERYLIWPEIETKIITEFRQEVLLKHQHELLAARQGYGGLPALLKDHQFNNLALLYRLFNFSGQDSLKPIADKFKLHILEEGSTLVNSVETRKPDGKELGLNEILNTSNLVDRLIKMVYHFQSMLKECF